MKRALLFILVLCAVGTAFGQDIPIPGVKIAGMTFREDLGLYEVAANGTVFYLTKDLRHVIVGNLFTVSTMENLTKKRIDEIYRVDFSRLDLSDAVKVSEGKRRLAVFSDPGCPYSRRLHQELTRLKDHAVYVFLSPFGDRSRAASIWCAEDRKEALDRVFQGGTVPPGTCSTDALDRNLAFARQQGINAVPTVVFEDGRRRVGYMKAEDLERIEEGK
jgi:thiol:disulfide interchange protein DsbC